MATRKPAQPLLVRQALALRVPPLENGDRLSGREFLRRYDAMPGVKKAELIAGTVFMPSPLRHDHAKPDMLVHLWLATYAAHTPGVEALSNPTVRLAPRSIPQPDAVLRVVHGGQTTVGADNFICGAPELVAEIAGSSASLDLHGKLHVFRRAGVREYFVWQIRDNAVHWFLLEDGDYKLIAPEGEGIVRSRNFPGLVLNTKALVAHDAPGILSSLEKGLKEPKHAAFLKRLRDPSSIAISRGGGH